MLNSVLLQMWCQKFSFAMDYGTSETSGSGSINKIIACQSCKFVDIEVPTLTILL